MPNLSEYVKAHSGSKYHVLLRLNITQPRAVQYPHFVVSVQPFLRSSSVQRLSYPCTYFSGCCADCRYQTIPLHRAAAYNHLDIATLLLEKGADIEVCSVASAAQHSFRRVEDATDLSVDGLLHTHYCWIS